MPRKTATTITEPFALWTELQRVREAGVAIDRGEAYEELECVAAACRQSSVLRPSAASSRSAKKTRPVYSSGFSHAAK